MNSAIITDEMVEVGARALNPDAFADYDRRLSYRASMDSEEERRRFADHYDERPEALRKARLVLEAAASLSGDTAEGQTWCQPMNCGKHMPRKFIVRFEDADMRDAIFDDEEEAYRYFEAVNWNWNCYLFGAMPRRAGRAALKRTDGEQHDG